MSEHPPSSQPSSGELPRTVVPSDVYDEHYFRSVCLGAKEWSESGGETAAGVYGGVLRRARLRPGETVVDIGTGRGEMLAVAIDHGAARALGVEYAEAAIPLARQTLRARRVADKGIVLAGDSRALPVRDGCADLVTMVDVVEHLSPQELALTFKEALRVLCPGGRIVIHTMPSRSIYNVTYRLLRLMRASRRRNWPVDPRNDYERAMHVNEQTVTSLRNALRRAGFRPARASLGSWVYTDFVPDERAKRVYAVLAKVPLLARLGIADLWGEGTRP